MPVDVGSLRRGIVGLCSALAMLLMLTACGPTIQTAGPAAEEPRSPLLRGSFFRTPDGVDLAVDAWLADDPRAVIIAVHGMNDYANAFAMPGAWWAARGITTYAYDQRGFGRTAQRGIWPGEDRMVDDLTTFITLVSAVYPDVPLFLLGESMGGAVAIAASARQDLPVDGVILVAPAVWGWSSQPFLYRASLWLSAFAIPGMQLDGGGLDIMPSDNIEMLRAYARDPNIIIDTRADAIYGLVDLMETGYASAGAVEDPVLLLYGEKDEIIPRRPVHEVALSLCGPNPRMAVYPEGYHMLLRDLGAETVWRDIGVWILDQTADLPSGAEVSRDVYGTVAHCR